MWHRQVRAKLCAAAILWALLSTLAGASAAFATTDSGDWQLVETDGATRVYTREVENSPFLEVKATTVIAASVEDITRHLGDGNSCAEWREMCESSSVLEQVSESESYIYQVLDLPWPISDRDLVIHSKTTIDPETRSATIDLRSDSTRHPPAKHVRAETRGKFVLTVLNDQEIEFTYIMHTDLGGDLSADLVNGRLAETAIDDLSRLKELAES